MWRWRGKGEDGGGQMSAADDVTWCGEGKKNAVGEKECGQRRGGEAPSGFYCWVTMNPCPEKPIFLAVIQ
jgi:hypothetical protein